MSTPIRSISYFALRFFKGAHPTRLKTFIKISSLSSGLVLASIALTNDVNNDKLSYIKATIRFLRSVKIAALISLDYSFSPLGLNESLPNYNIMMSRVHTRSAERLVEGCLQNGGTYIKLGQGLACMNHVLPTEYCETLKSLQDKCLDRESDEVQKLFMEDFGQTPCQIFETFNSRAIAAASLAQVFRATTKDGVDVAVKVQYNDLQQRFHTDITTIQYILRMIGFVHKDFNFAWILVDLQDTLKQELDFINEGKNSERCAEDLKHLDYVYVPKVMWPLCSSRVLVTEYIDGYKISDVQSLKQNGFSLADINFKLFQTFGEQIFNTGFVHADPHPGNVFIRRYNKKTQLVLLDHGLYETLSEKDRVALSNMWKAIVVGDQQKMEKHSLELGVEDYIMFAQVLTQMPLRRNNFKLLLTVTEEDKAHIQEFAQHRFEKIMTVLRTMPRTLLLIIRNLNTIRAIALEHGNPVDRYKVLTRAATRISYEQQSIFSRLLNIPGLLYFEFKLLTLRFSAWLQNLLMKVAGLDIKSQIEDRIFQQIG